MPRPKTALQPLPRMVPDPGSQGLISPSLGGAGATAKLDTQAAMAPALGVAKIGEGLQDAGSAVAMLAQKKAEADAITAEHQSALLIQQANADIAKATQGEMDQSKWSGIADARLNQLQGDLKNIPNVNPKAREAIDYKYASNAIDVRDGLDRHAVQKSIGDAQKSIDATINYAGDTGDLALGLSTIRGAVEKKFKTPEQGREAEENLRQQVQTFQTKQQKEQFLGAVQADANKALELARSPNNPAPPSLKAWQINAAQEGVREQTSELTQVSQDEVAKGLAGELANPQDVPAWKQKHPGMSDEQAQQIEAAIVRRNSNTRKQYIAANAPAIASELYTAVQEFDASNPEDKGTIADYTDLRMRIGELPEDAVGNLRKTLDAKMANKPIPVDKTLQGYAHKYTDGLMRNDQSFGQYKSPAFAFDTREMVNGKPNPMYGVDMRDEKGNRIPQWNPDGTPKLKEDPKMKEVALARKSQVDRAVTGALHQHPEWAKDPNGEAKIREVVTKELTGPTIAAIFDSIGLHAAPTAADPQPFRKRQREAPPKAEPVKEEAPPKEEASYNPADDNEPVSALAESVKDKRSKSSADLAGGDLFPVGEDGNVVGGDSMFTSLPEQNGGDLPPETKKRKR